MAENPEQRRCEGCGEELDAQYPESLCPKCLLKAGLRDSGRVRSLRIRCPHCHQPVEVLANDPLVDVDCPSCGSSFNLAVSETTTFDPGENQTIGHFELLNILGTGHFGSVWEALDSELDRKVAIKLPRRNQLDDLHVEQFLREARAAAQLHHPNIVSVHEVGRENGQVYIVSDFVEGVTLADWLTAERPTSKEAAELCAKIAVALHHAHEAGVIHRDLKPSNVMIDADGEPHIMDFGLAKREAGEITMTVEGKILGTPAYMSPEQARGEAHKADRRSDVYSLGVILFELLTAERPFRGNTTMLLHQVIHEEATSPRKLKAAVPRDLETICLKCLDKDPNGRYLTAFDLSTELLRYIHGEPIEARPLSSTTQLWRWCKRQPVVAGLVVSLFISLTVGAVTSGILAVVARRQAGDAIKAHTREVGIRQEAESAKAKLERSLYIADMHRVANAWNRGDVGETRNLLKAQMPKAGQEDFRSFDWYYFWKLSHDNPKTLYGHTDSVRAVDFLPDGLGLATGGSDHTVRLWDLSTGLERLTIYAHSDEVTALEVSPTGELIASASLDGSVQLWNARTGEQEASLSGHQERVNHLKFSPSGSLIATAGGDKEVRLWTVQTGKPFDVLGEHAGAVSDIAFSPEGDQLTVASEKTVRIWDVRQKEMRTFWDHPGPVVSVSYSPDGKLLASASEELIFLWDIENETHTRLRNHKGDVTKVAFSPNGKTFASASYDKTTTVWDVSTLSRKFVVRGHTGPVENVMFSPDATMLATFGRESVRLWDSAEGIELAAVRDVDLSDAVSFSPDGQSLALSDQIWSVTSALGTKPFPEDALGAFHLEFSPDGQTVAALDWGTPVIPLWDVESGRIRALCMGHEFMAHDVTFSADSELMVSGGTDSTVRLWDVASGRELAAHDRHDSRVRKVAFVHDSQMLASVDQGGTIIVWNQATQKEVARYPVRGRLVFSVFGGIASLPESETVFCTSHPDNSFSLWHMESGSLLATLSGHSHQLTALSISPDGKTMASAALDRSLRFWNVREGNEFRRTENFEKLFQSLEFSPDGKTLASAYLSGDVALLDVETGKSRTFSTVVGGYGISRGVYFWPDTRP